MEKRAIPLLIWIFLQFQLGFTAKNKPTQRNISINRDHVSVWFEPPIQEGIKYDQENLVEMIDLVGGTFGSILISPAPPMPDLVSLETQNDSVLLIPDLVAMHNQKNGNNTLKVIVSFTISNDTHATDSLGPGNTSTKFSNEIAKFMADRANSIHPGTVDTLLLLDKDILPSKVDTTTTDKLNTIYNSLQTLKSTRILLKNELGGTSYKLGLLISFRGYLEGEDYLPEILENIDLLVPVIYFDEFYMEPLEEHQLLQDLFGHCEEGIREMNSDVEIVPLVSCRPPINTDFGEVSKFLECWPLMSNWTVENNRNVIMYEAFDQYEDQVKNAGWWRLKSETSSDENETGMEKVAEISFLAKVDETFGVTFKSGDPFSSQATIFFDHRVRHHSLNKFYSEKEVREMLELVMSQFTSIAIGNMRGGHIHDNIPKVIPRLVAQLNQENCKDPTFQPFTIISNIHNNIYIWNLDRRDLDWDKTWHAALSANKIFPGTVRIIAFKSPSNEDPELTIWKDYLAALEKAYGNSTFTNIRIGIYLDLPDCHSFLKDEFPSFRQWVSVLILDISGSVSAGLQHQYVDFQLSRLFAEWRKCNESFKANYSAVNVILQVTCSNLVNNGGIDQEAKCWEIVNNWSKENQAEVIFHQAFETPKTNIGYMHEGRYHEPEPVGGWWKLKQRSQYEITKDSFVERFRDLMQDSETISANDDEDTACLECDSHCNTGHTVFVTAIVVGCTSSIILTVYWYIRRMQRLGGRICEIELM